MQGLKLPVPSFGHLSDLFAAVPIKIKLFCQNIRRRIASGEEIDLIADSTGLRFGKASHWYETKYNRSFALGRKYVKLEKNIFSKEWQDQNVVRIYTNHFCKQVA